ncbi:PhoG like DNA-binding family protein [Aspergillus heteromorphus CBS 117.55]|uniref:PhoG like DNA-binding family protein n=1 Tax=Aspergillus heteromorphus CBS 117.55 TaxID=1448321 RepID=A0A317VI04_9EURO|nr:PhoG like DNA-binding family protein [Aspergillus heteromorphus CBS 117.55]PWY71480.1 PhoG like DNA-binding family protein [Aspergillus heteromorphus CBS 117.55]
MEGFDTMTMPYLASPLSLGNIQGPEYLNPIPGMDMPDQRSNFDSETFVSSDDISFAQHALPPTLKRFPASYEDPFTDMVTPFEPAPPEQPPDASIDHNNKLLSFSMPAYNFTLLDYSLRRTSISLSAQLHGMFFLAESPWTTSPTENSPPQQGAELTCYRRNLFQITGSVTLPRSLRYIMTEQGDRIPILAQELTVSATESVEGNSVKIISVPWKTPAVNSNPTAEDTNHPSGGSGGSTNNNNNTNLKVEKEPPPIPLDIMAGQDLDTDYATFPIAWKRLQFRVATANNGRRKELQQHFVVRLKVVATLSTGAKIPICEVHSGPVIVRGRSPRNFQSRKDLPLSGSAAASRKSAQAAQSATVTRTPTSDSVPQSNMTPARTKATLKSSSPETAASQGGGVPQQASPGWTQIPPPMGCALPSTTLPHSTVYSQSSPEFSRPAESQPHPTTVAAPINLSLLDEEGGEVDDNHGGESVHPAGPARSASSYSNDISHENLKMKNSAPPAKLRKLSHGLPQASSRSTASSVPLLNTTTSMQPFASTLPFPNESADLLYEYFPLGLDDWQAPVDAVYRPHVVHHTNLPEVKFVTARGRNKRYFAAEDVF